MSRRWNSVLQVRLGPAAVHASLSSGWWRPEQRAAAHRSIDAEAPAPGRAPNPEWLTAARSALVGTIDEIDTTHALRGAPLQLEIADALVLLDVAHGELSGLADRQLDAVAKASCAELLGGAEADSAVRWALQRDERHLLVCALHRELTTLVAEVAGSRQLRLASLQPHFLRQWNRHAGTLQPGRGVFAVAADGAVLIACVDEGVITTIGRGPCPAQDGLVEGRTARIEELIDSLHLEHTDSRPDLLDAHFDRAFADSGLSLPSTSAFEMAGDWLRQRRAHHIERCGSDPLADALDDDTSTWPVDARVDRLLAVSGDDPATQSSYVLVAEAGLASLASPRWALRDPGGSQA